MAQSLYEVLGVPKGATADAIRSAYRKLAKKHHPDVNPDKKSEEKFKSITAAYDVLSDEKRRAAYDEFGDIALQAGFDPAKAREHARWQNAQRQQRQHVPQHDGEHGGWGGMGFDIEDLLGRVGRSRGPMKGGDLSATIQIDLRQAIEGAEFSGELPGHGVVRVRIPPGADTGSTLRVPGKGAPGPNGGPAGDLVLEIELRPHPLIRRDGLDLYLSLPVTLDEAYNGATVDVPTFEGPIALKIPPRSQNGAKLRVRGRGVPKKGTRGDLYVELDIRMPDKHDDALAAAVKGALYSSPVRSKTTLD